MTEIRSVREGSGKVCQRLWWLWRVQGWIGIFPSLLFSFFMHIKRESHPFPQVCSPNSCTEMFSFFLGIWSVEEKVYLVGRCLRDFSKLSQRGKKLLKNKNKLAKGYMMQGGLLAIVLVCEPAFCLNPCRAASSCGLGITDLGCLSSLWWTASHYCHTPWVCLMWAGYKYLKKKKKSLQWYSLHFYSWILSPNFYSLSSIWGFIKHHKLELSFRGKQDDLISMGLPLLHQITFLLWVSWSPQLWLWLSSQSGDRRSPVQLTLCILVGFFFFFSKGREWEKFFHQVFSSNFTS